MLFDSENQKIIYDNFKFFARPCWDNYYYIHREVSKIWKYLQFEVRHHVKIQSTKNKTHGLNDWLSVIPINKAVVQYLVDCIENVSEKSLR